VNLRENYSPSARYLAWLTDCRTHHFTRDKESAMGIMAWIALAWPWDCSPICCSRAKITGAYFHPPGSPSSPKQRPCCWPATGEGQSPQLVRDHDRSVGPRRAVIGVCTVRDAMASDAGADCLSCRSMRQWCHLARLDLSGPCAPSPLAVFRVEGGETRDQSCDQATLRERGAA
jgi:hypothetical protein